MRLSLRAFAATFLIAALPLLANDAATATDAQAPAAPPPVVQPAAEEPPAQAVVPCRSEAGERQHCAADTTQGVALARSTGSAACLLGKTWGYDATGVWVSDGCGGDFIAGAQVEAAVERRRPLQHVPNVGFLLFSGDDGEIYFRLFSYARYLNQSGLDSSYTDYFGNEKSVDLREDVQLNKFFAPFSGWYLTPKFRYYLYVWSSNPSQGDPAQVVGAGNLTYSFNRFVAVGAGITSLPSVRSTEGQFPYWLGVDDRLIADEFFRGSYTSGIWLKGELHTKLKYMAMVANNLSTLGVSASQLDAGLDTQSFMLQWLPTTGEFGLFGTFGDYDYHEKVATRVGLHYTHSREDEQTQPGTNAIENSQIRLTDGSVIFTPNLFGDGITINRVSYEMSSLDAGIKYKGMSVEAEYYWRNLDNFVGTNVPEALEPIDDHGYQIQVSGMVVKDVVQVYAGRSEIFGDYGDAAENRVGVNYYPVKKRGFRLNAEYLDLQNCPVGYTAVPYPVGGNGGVFHANLELNF